MTLEELDQEDLTIREVIHDLETTIARYRQWLAANEAARHAVLDDMARARTAGQ
jgi:hypothetical protein